jgi:hypothetical protein
VYPEQGQVLHFSEDPTIQRFSSRTTAAAPQPEACVWAVDAHNAPSYWFPRNCPRAMAWMTPSTTDPKCAGSLGGQHELVQLVQEWAVRKGATAAQISLAWLLARRP